ncbi:hypothetical protein RO3G_14671 [Lichtheimia corymbifera JMRC:FSU:9682]|uniref:RRM domain-containing protein n=1 Tax=Lichtheimia corymbifera JMRC:FSU:9682 TaxID=1263082 RepID=A0A068RM02_9FUNG|nr:hypothetical protein RO3G_14671 [Lichtheimia corymbifera JMRC:FSU:9682]
MSTAAAANAIRNSAMTPTRMFFRTSQTIPSMAHARTVFKALGEYGDMIEYKFLRCPETRQYLSYGFVVYKNNEDAQKAASQRFIKVPSDMFEKPCEVKIEKSVKNRG